MNNLIEKKVAYGTGAGGIVTLILGLAATYHWFTPPPPYLTALGVSLLSGLVGYLAPHTTLASDVQPVQQAYPAVHHHPGIERVEKAVWELGQDLSRMRVDVLGALHSPPAAAVQPSATGTAAPVAASVSISDPAPRPTFEQERAALPDPTHPYGGSAS